MSIYTTIINMLIRRYLQYDLTANSVIGINMLKSSMGRFVLTLGLFSLLAIWKNPSWYPPAILGTTVILVTRLLSVVQDGGAEII